MITLFYSYGFLCISGGVLWRNHMLVTVGFLKVEQITFLNEKHFVCRLEWCADIQPMIPM